MKSSLNPTAMFAVAIFLGGAAPTAPSANYLPLDRGSAMAYAQQLRRAWVRNHPDEPADASGDPKILSGMITTSTVNVQTPASGPGAEFKFKTDKSGLSYADFVFTGPSGGLITILYQPGNYPSSGDVDALNTALGPYTQPGSYTITEAHIVSNDGSFTEYDAAQISALFSVSTFQLTNSNAGDSVAPTISGGKIATKTVTLSSSKPALVIDLNVSDNLSGVSECNAYLSDPNNEFYDAQGSTASPVVSEATVPVGLYFGAFATPPAIGTWTITEIYCGDLAGNNAFVFGPTAITALLGANTFKVVN